MNLRWILNPYSKTKILSIGKNVSEINQAIMEILSDYNVKITSKLLYDDIYEYIASNLGELPSEIMLDIESKLDLINYVRLKYIINVNLDIKLNNDSYKRYYNVRFVLQKMIGLVYNVNIDDVLFINLKNISRHIIETDSNDAGISFENQTPVEIDIDSYNSSFMYVPTYKGYSVYVSPTEYLKLNSLIKPLEYLDIYVLSSDPLTPFAMGRLSRLSSISSETFRTLRMSTSKKCLYTSSMKVDNLESYIRTLKREGYTALIPDSFTDSDVYPEICTLWGTLYRVEDIIIVKDESPSKNCSRVSWYNNALDEILSGKIPKVLISLNHYVNYHGDLNYAVKKLYEDFTVTNPSLQPFIEDVSRVNPDLTFTARFYDINQYKDYIKLLSSVDDVTPPLMSTMTVMSTTFGINQGIELPKIDPKYLVIEKLCIYESYTLSLTIPKSELLTSDNDGAYLFKDDTDYSTESKLKGDTLTPISVSDTVSKVLYESDDESKVIEVRTRLLDLTLDYWSAYILSAYGKMSRSIFSTLTIPD